MSRLDGKVALISGTARFAGQVPHGSAKGGVFAMTKHLCAAGGQYRSSPIATATSPGVPFR